jgi:hypothetical protein
VRTSLRPIVPILRRLWWRLTPWIDNQPHRIRRAERRIAAFREKADRIRPLTRPEFETMVDQSAYCQGRWGYTAIALAQAADLIEDHGLRSALELGAPIRPVIVGSDLMDKTARHIVDPNVSTTIHDARKVPWPYEDRSYDLFVALQVFEHLGDRQREAFMEVRRIARHAILSLPIDWQMDDPRNSHHQISHERVLSWFVPIVPTRVLLVNGGRRKRLVYVFEDLAAP